MRKSKIKKRGEMSSKMLVTIILLVIGFGIILLIYSQLSWNGQVDRETCHESVVLRGTLPETLGINALAPLKCATNKICVRGKKLFGKGECEEFTNVKAVTYANVNNLNEVEKLIAGEVVDCWSMMGQGKISLFSEGWAAYGVGGVYPTCVICSRIAFDKKTLREKGINIEQRDVLGYMMTHKIPNGNKSYYDYLAGDSPAKISVKETISIPLINEDGTISPGNSSELKLEDFYEEDNGETKELAILFMQISTPTKMASLGNIGKLALGTAGATTVVGGAGVTLTLGKGLAKAVGAACKGWPSAAICGAIVAVAIGVQQIKAEYNRGVVATHCGDVSSGEEARQGCSVVRTVNYNVEEISQYCSVIESIP